MIISPTLGYTAKLDITIADVPVDYNRISKIDIEYDANKHDMASIRMSGIPPKAVTEYRGAPVRILARTGGNYGLEFYGYVEQVRPIHKARGGLINETPFQDAVITCMGASYTMRGERTRLWEERSLKEIVASFAYLYKMSYSVPETDIVHERLVQNSESDFSFLVHMAAEFGYDVTVHGTHIDVWDPYTALDRGKGLYTLTTFKDVLRKPQPAPGQVMELEGTFGRHSSDGVYKNTSVTVLDERGASFDVTSKDVFGTAADASFPDRRTAIVDSYAEAEHLIRAERRGTYDYSVTATVMGIAGAVPGTVAKLTGFDASYNGYWYISGVKHSMATGAFTSVLQMHRNADDHWENGKVERFKTPPAARVENGKWRASKLQGDTRAI